MSDARETSELDAFDRLISAFNKHRVDFIIVGGFAVIYHGHVRATRDLDILVRRTDENARKAVAAIQEAGFSSPDLLPEVFTQDNGISIGLEPLQVDVLSNLPGVDFDQAWSRREISLFGAEKASYLSRQDLILSKRAVGRPQDRADLEILDRARRDEENPGA